mmetsp:Transcript_90048/g.288820  ORF Transcript_90048/g.288820 Transcript_90048/m.288820 type:complete len:187 (+) Transcript_90048:2569-3129(+)
MRFPFDVAPMEVMLQAPLADAYRLPADDQGDCSAVLRVAHWRRDMKVWCRACSDGRAARGAVAAAGGLGYGAGGALEVLPVDYSQLDSAAFLGRFSRFPMPEATSVGRLLRRTRLRAVWPLSSKQGVHVAARRGRCSWRSPPLRLRRWAALPPPPPPPPPAATLSAEASAPSPRGRATARGEAGGR